MKSDERGGAFYVENARRAVEVLLKKAVSHLRCPYMFDFVRFCSILSGFWLALKVGGG
jgi:hypothetical protein